MGAEGGIYKGGFDDNNKRAGNGEYMWPNGDRYKGDFSNNMKNGNGVLYFSNGDKRGGFGKMINSMVKLHIIIVGAELMKRNGMRITRHQKREESKIESSYSHCNLICTKRLNIALLNS